MTRMVWMALASIGVALRHGADFVIYSGVQRPSANDPDGPLHAANSRALLFDFVRRILKDQKPSIVELHSASDPNHAGGVIINCDCASIRLVRAKANQPINAAFLVPMRRGPHHRGARRGGQCRLAMARPLHHNSLRQPYNWVTPQRGSAAAPHPAGPLHTDKTDPVIALGR